jgi:Uma2 family endonuclease
MQMGLPDLNTPATLVLDRDNRLTDETYFAFCTANPDLDLERTPEGEIVIVPPCGGESDYRSVKAVVALDSWAVADKRGKSFGSSVQFILPDGSALLPDAAWASNQRLAALSKAERRQFLRLTPEFVIEMLSPSDRLDAAKRKMRLWAANGVELGWLIDADNRQVYAYREKTQPRLVSGAECIAGEGPVEGFVLPLADIRAGLAGPGTPVAFAGNTVTQPLDDLTPIGADHSGQLDPVA